MPDSFDGFCSLWPGADPRGYGMRALVGFKFFISRFCHKSIFSPGSVSTNGASLNGNAGRFADLIKFRGTVL